MNTKTDRKVTYKQAHLTRHLDYLNGSAKDRRNMKLSNIGPLTHDDGLQICLYLQKMTENFFPNKPKHFTSNFCDLANYSIKITL